MRLVCLIHNHMTQTIHREKLTKLAQLNKPSAEYDIRRYELHSSTVIPRQYALFLLCSNGLCVYDDKKSLTLYALDELSEQNKTYEVKEYLPGWLMIGDDGGGRGIFVKLDDDSAQPYLMGMGSMLMDEARTLADNLCEWLEQGFPLDD